MSEFVNSIVIFWVNFGMGGVPRFWSSRVFFFGWWWYWMLLDVVPHFARCIWPFWASVGLAKSCVGWWFCIESHTLLRSGSMGILVWLVVWNIFIFPYIGNNHPNWLIFFRGVGTTNQYTVLSCFIHSFIMFYPSGSVSFFFFRGSLKPPRRRCCGLFSDRTVRGVKKALIERVLPVGSFLVTVEWIYDPWKYMEMW